MMITIVREVRVRPIPDRGPEEPDIVYRIGESYPYWPQYFWLLDEGYGVKYCV